MRDDDADDDEQDATAAAPSAAPAPSAAAATTAPVCPAAAAALRWGQSGGDSCTLLLRSQPDWNEVVNDEEKSSDEVDEVDYFLLFFKLEKQN